MAITLDAVLALKTKQAQNSAKLTKEEVRKLKEELEQTRREAQATERSMRQMGGTASRLGRLSGQLGSAMGRTTGVLGRLSPGLAEAAILTSDLADATEVATAGGASLLRVLGPVAVAVGVAGAAYAILNAQLKNAEERQKKAAESAEELVALNIQVKETALQAALARGELTQAEFDAQASAKGAREVFSGRVQGLLDERREIEQNIRALKERKKEAEDAPSPVPMGSFGRERSPGADQRAFQAGDALDATRNEQIESFQSKLINLDKQLALAQVAQANYERNLNDIASAADSTSTSVGSLGAAAEDTGNAAQEAAAQAQRAWTRGVEQIQRDLEGMNDTLDGAAWEQWASDLENALDRVAFKIAPLQASMGLAERGINSLGTAGGQQAVSSVLGTGGNPLALLGLAGPLGGAAAASLGGLAQLGGMDEAQLEDMFTGLGDDILDGVDRLPQVIGELLPDLVTQLVTELPPALALALAQTLIELVPGLERKQNRREFFDENKLGQLIKTAFKFTNPATGGIGTIIGSGLNGLFSGEGLLSGLTGGVFGGGRDSGGTIPRDGLYLLHQGEQILRTSGIGSNGSLSAAGMNGRLMVQIAAPASLPTIQNIEVMTGPGGIWEDGNG